MNDTQIARGENTPVENTRNSVTVTPPVDIYENDDEILLYADMPGVGKEDLSINIEEGTLTIEGWLNNSRYGRDTNESLVAYKRQFSVSKAVDIEKVQAGLRQGVLKLTLPKSPAFKPRKIEIKAG